MEAHVHTVLMNSTVGFSRNRVQIIITKSVMHQGPESIPLHNEINCQINQNVEIVKLDLNFLGAPKRLWIIM